MVCEVVWMSHGDEAVKMPNGFEVKARGSCTGFQDVNWGTFKPVLTDALIDHLQPIQTRYEEIIYDTAYSDQVLAECVSKASDIADKTVSNVYRAMGFLRR
nr:pentatricopeptide repeat-containing protein At1g11290, chloroplastic-like isoform X1 [Tanacetum cinerariifolium]